MKFRLSCAAVAITAVLSGPAAAADLGGNCCADLEERIAELEATTARKGNRKVKLEISGQVNEAMLWWDDGKDDGPGERENRNLYLGTNDTARTRFRFKGEAKIDSDWKAGYLLEIGVRANRLSRTDETTDEPAASAEPTSGTPSQFDVRHSAWWIEHKQFGRFWMGQTSQAADGITEINLANMNHFARLSASKWNMSNRIIVKETGQRSADRRWRDLLPQDGFTGDNVPGEGDRHSLIKWVSPTLHGFEVSAAWGEDDFWDVALRYKGEIGDFKIAGGIAYAEYTDANQAQTPVDNGALPAGSLLPESLRGCAVPTTVTRVEDSDNDCNQLGLSGSVMHDPTGLFVHAAYGIKSDELRDTVFRTGTRSDNFDDHDWFWGVQAGIEKKFFDLGKTTLYGEFAHFEAGAQIGDVQGNIRTFNSAFPNQGAGANFSRGSEVEFWGIGVNQHIEKAAMDLYLAYRHHEGEITLGDTRDGGSQKFDIEPIDLIMSGAMIKF